MNVHSTIEVRFTIYQYNSGLGDNGTRKIKETFPMTEEGLTQARELTKRIKSEIQHGRDEGHGQGGRAIASEYCWDGFVRSFDGMIRVDVLHDEVEHVLG